MLNQSFLVGRLVRKPELRETEKGKRMCFLSLAVPRSFKNMSGEYDADFIDCVLWDQIASVTVEHCDKGDLICVKGRIQSRIIEEEDSKHSKLEIIAEKVSFLTSKEEKAAKKARKEEKKQG